MMCETRHPETPTSARRKFLQGSGALAATVAGLTSGISAPAFAVQPLKPHNVITPDDAIARLQEGNARYVAGLMQRHDFASEREPLNGGQNPYAALLGCADSRVAPEYAFDSVRGDLFTARVAGNIASDEATGSLEYAVGVLKVPLILVLGHDKCGAVEAALSAHTKGTKYPGSIQTLVRKIESSVRKIDINAPDRLDAAVAQNVRDNVNALRTASAILRDAETKGTLKIIGGVYRLGNGKVDLIA
ncbi:carbonic anhydrase [Pandoraea capi]|uniref:Carbonic anhydrase n=1 Tax=Pandoraea capi TaxID=2508286 RepID=A0ABY6VWA9_9BURK|nr:carbonic anhydrase [Pandoraea capi]VVD96583.1 carbonic anhydrase [Pandoraea capi]